VKSLNLLVPDMWSRLWANEFLLRKPQYFLTHTYEGRRNTPLRGDWDLEGGLIAVKPPGEARRQITAHYALVDTRSPQFVRATLNGSWYDEERDPKNGERWRWSRPGADILLENPQHSPVRLRITLDGWSLGGPRYLSLVLAGAAPSVPTPGTLVGTERRKTSLPEIIVPPGRSILMFSAPQPPREPSVGGIDGDPRSLEFCVFGLELEVTAAK